MTKKPRERAILVGAALLPLVVMAAVSVLRGTSIPNMTRDVAAIAGIHPLAGALSSLGILLWWTSACVWLVAAAMHHHRLARGPAMFSLTAAALSAYLALDDLFQFHEHLAPIYLRIPEKAVLGVLALCVGAWLVRFRAEILRHGAPLLVASLGLLAASVLLDVVLEPWMARFGHWSFFFEDGLKWLGICAWLAFCAARFRADFLPTPLARATGHARSDFPGRPAAPTPRARARRRQVRARV